MTSTLISKLTHAATHPVGTAIAVTGHTMGVAVGTVKTVWHLGERITGQGRGGEATTVGPESAPTAPTARSTAQRAPSARAATAGPALAQMDTEAVDEEELRTPSGIPAADEGFNPDTTDTSLHQPGTEPLMDPATVKAVKSESETMQRAADTDKG